MNSLTFVIPGRAVALMRPRINMGAIRRFKGAGKGGGPLVYTPYKCKKWQKLVKDTIAKLPRVPRFEYPTHFTATFYLKRPGKFSKYALRPDIDNYVKNLMDGLEGALFEDDSCVTGIMAVKQWVDDRESERTLVSVSSGLKA